MLHTITQADQDLDIELAPVILEFDQDDTLYLCHVDALESTSSTANGNVYVELVWHDDASFAVSPFVRRARVLDIPVGAYSDNRLHSYDFTFRAQNPGEMLLRVSANASGNYSIDLNFSIVSLPIDS